MLNRLRLKLKALTFRKAEGVSFKSVNFIRPSDRARVGRFPGNFSLQLTGRKARLSAKTIYKKLETSFVEPSTWLKSILKLVSMV
jgi:hypothetical protein